MKFLAILLALLSLCASSHAANFAISPPFKIYADTTGQPLNSGFVYFGQAGQNAQTNPIQVYWDKAGTQPAAQPIRTLNGFLSRNGAVANVYIGVDHSTLVRNSRQAIVYSATNSTDIELAGAILASAGGAAAIAILDSGGFYAGANVEAALQEAAQAATIRIADGGSLYAATNVEDALQEPVPQNRLASPVQQALVPTGTVLDYAGRADVAAPAGWVYGSGRTIGDALSGATERANADTQALYVLWWEATSNSDVVIQDLSGTPLGSRGASALADFNAHRRLPLPDCRGRVIATKDNLGGSTAGNLSAAGGAFDGTAIGKAGGAQNQTLTNSQLPNHSHTVTDPQHAHGTSQTNHAHTSLYGSAVSVAPGAGSALDVSGSGASTTGAQANITILNASTGISIPATAGGASPTGGGSHPNVQPTLILSKIIKLCAPWDFAAAN